MKQILFLTLLFFTGLVQSQTVLTSPQQAMELAKTKSRDLHIAQYRVQQEKEQVKISRSVFVPQVKAVSNFDYNYALPVQLIPAEFLGGLPGDYRSIQFGTKFNWTAGVEASVPLINTSVYSDQKLAQLNYEAATQGLRNAELEIMKQVVRGYYLTLLSSQSLKISERNFEIADSLKQIAEHRYKNELLEQIDYNRIVGSWLRTKNDVERNRAALTNNSNALKYFLGLDQQDSVIVIQSLDRISEPIGTTAEAEHYPSVKEKQLQVNGALWGLRKEKLKRAPELSLYGRYLGQAQRNEFNFFDSSQPWYTIGVAGIRFEAPLFTGYIRRGNIQKLEYRYRIQQLELDKEKQRMKLEDEELNTNFKNSFAEVENLEKNYRMSDENNKIAFYKYSQGVFSLDQYLNVYNESLNVQGQYIHALANLYITKSIIELKNNLQ